MAILKAPLLSIDARGQFAKSIVYSGWKGLKTARQHVVPANPQTADQTTQRSKVTSGVSAWKNYFTHAIGRAAWNRMALALAGALSGFNAFMRNLLDFIATTPDASFVNWGKAVVGNLVVFYTLNIDDGAVGDEAGNFEIWVGSTITNMTLSEEVALAGGNIISTEDLGDIGDIVYCKVRKDSIDRSGIFRFTLE